jgi:hypothetical protein
MGGCDQDYMWIAKSISILCNLVLLKKSWNAKLCFLYALSTPTYRLNLFIDNIKSPIVTHSSFLCGSMTLSMNSTIWEFLFHFSVCVSYSLVSSLVFASLSLPLYFLSTPPCFPLASSSLVSIRPCVLTLCLIAVLAVWTSSTWTHFFLSRPRKSCQVAFHMRHVFWKRTPEVNHRKVSNCQAFLQIPKRKVPNSQILVCLNW